MTFLRAFCYICFFLLLSLAYYLTLLAAQLAKEAYMVGMLYGG